MATAIGVTGRPGPSGGGVRVFVWLLHMALPLLGLWLLLARPDLDLEWRNHPSHFWLVAGVAAVSVFLGLRMQTQARRRDDARLLLVGLSFTTAAGFLFLHALATPGVLVSGPNLGFTIATPVGLGLASLLLAASAVDLPERRSGVVVRAERTMRSILLGLLGAWAAASLAGVPPLGLVPGEVDVHGPLVVLAVVSVALYGVAAVGYLRIHRRRPAVMLVGLVTASTLLAEAMVTVVFAHSWLLSWWLWHVLMAAGFGFFTYAAYVQYRREGSPAGLFNAISTEQTVQRIRAEYGSALESLTAAFRRSEVGERGAEELDLVTAGLAARFDLTEGQTEVLGRAAEALAAERSQARRLGALVEIGAGSRVRTDEDRLLRDVVAHLRAGFGRDMVRIGLVRDGELRFPDAYADPDWERVGGEVLSFPLTIEGGRAGVVEIRRKEGTFADRDRAIGETLAAELSIVLENVRLYGQVEGLFRQYTSPDVATALLADPGQARLGGAVVDITSLFADLRGFTSFSERSSPDRVVEVLNRYFGLAVPVVLDAGGTVVQFIGDALLAVFNAPARQSDHALRACRAALDMQEAIEAVVVEHPEWPRFRIGINTGPALVGNIGSARMRSFNVMGDAVNVAARLEGVAVPGQVVIGGSTYEAVGEAAVVEPLGAVELKGKERPVDAYRLLEVGGR